MHRQNSRLSHATEFSILILPIDQMFVNICKFSTLLFNRSCWFVYISVSKKGIAWLIATFNNVNDSLFKVA